MIDASTDQVGRTPAEVRDGLKALFSSQTLFRFTFKGDNGTDESYLVTALDLETVEQAGASDVGQYRLRLAEVN